jgi:hypothetical protein
MDDPKHRTQLSLEGWQYESLKARGEREGRSLSDLVREAVTEYLADRSKPAAGRGRLGRIRGLGADREVSGRDHDRVLYGGGG